MRILSLVFSLVVTVSLAAAALIYLENRVGQQRIYVQDEWLSTSDQQAYRSYGELGNSESDTTRYPAPSDSSTH
jgi:hypothetical protein